MGGICFSASATSSSIAVPEAPSFAPGIGRPRLAESGSESATGRVSQWVTYRIRLGSDGRKRARMLLNSSFLPAAVTWVNAWTSTLSALALSSRSSQSAIALCPGIPGTRGPAATWNSDPLHRLGGVEPLQRLRRAAVARDAEHRHHQEPGRSHRGVPAWKLTVTEAP